MRILLGTATVIALAGALLIVLVLWQTYRWADQPLLESPASGEVANIVLEPGQSYGTLTRKLVSAGIMDSPRTFALYGELAGFDTRLKPGEYAIEQGITPHQLLLKIANGEVVRHSVRIAEGSTLKDLRKTLAQVAALRHETQQLEETALAQLLQEELDALTDEKLEGVFFPDTYSITLGDTDLDVLRRAALEMVERVNLHWQQRDEDLRLKTPYELLILASIIEKESALESDRVLISQVFNNRLKSGMLLQTDPTVIYGLGDEFDGNLTRAHLRQDSAYNTYKIKGLPPTPIALPSEASIKAAAHPKSGDFLYFVARGDGSSQFSKTLEEHNAAVYKYQIAPAKVAP